MKPSPKTTPPPEPEEWDLNESFGIIPKEIPLSHNLGCVRSSKNLPTDASKIQGVDRNSKKP